MESRKKRRNTEYIDDKKTKNNKWKLPCLILLCLMIFIYYQVYILFNYTMGKNVTENQIALYKWMAGKVHSSEKVPKDTSLDIAVIGNIKVRNELLDSYEKGGIVDYSSIFENISFKNYDYTIANLNTSIVQDTKPGGEFYANSKLLKELNGIGIDLLITATKELAEEDNKIIEETHESIVNEDIKYVGNNINKDEASYYIIDKNDIKIAVLSYVEADYCENDITNVYSKKALKEDIKSVNKEEVDLVIVFIDALRSNQTKIKEDKKELLQEILKEGVDLVISSDTLEQKLYQNTDKTKYIKYSLGDTIGLQNEDGEDISKVLKITVNRKIDDGKEDVSFEVIEDKTLVALSNSDKTRYKIVELEKEIEDFDETSPRITVAEYNYLLGIKKSKNVDL